MSVTGAIITVLVETNQANARDGAMLERVALLPLGAQGDQGGDGLGVANGRIYVSNNAEGTVTVIADACR